ncbi:MAG: hypothetical protein R6U00_08210 [Prochlorococcaceae cyanobacterium]
MKEFDGQRLLELERQARRDGSGIDAAQLAGPWELRQLWSREQATPQAPQAALLRLLGARLTSTPASPNPSSPNPSSPEAPNPDAPLQLVNSVRLGALELRFCGWGRLLGRRPLLQFGFERLELRLGERRLLQRPLPPAEARNLPFFALIATGSDSAGRWLLARGRGGGLACWRCPSADASADAGQQLAAQR